MKIAEIIAKVNKWHSYAQVRFLEKIAHLITVAIRDIIENQDNSTDDKLEAIKWVNEFQQRVLVNIMTVKNGELNEEFKRLQHNIHFYGSKNQITKNSIAWSILKAYERTTYQLDNPTVRAKEQYIIMNALNEVSSGAYAIDEEEFYTLMGAERSEVLQLWDDLNNNWVNKYEIRKDKDESCIAHSLVNWGQPIDENKEEVLFFFEAKNYTRASEIFNRFLGFEPYVPMPENVAAQRIFVLNDKNNKKIKEVTLIIYQPIKNNSGEWSCSYQISEIKNNALFNVLGIDALQSFELALHIINGLLQGYNRDNENKIVWDGQIDHLIYTIK